MGRQKGHPAALAEGFTTFLGHVATGFSRSAFGDTLCSEVSAGCIARRTGKPATLQALGRILLDEPDHNGVAKALRRLSTLIAEDPAFEDVKIDYTREFWEAIRLAQFDDPDEGFAQISYRRAYTRPSLPKKAISTVHKAKGLECNDVLIIPCDARHFSNSAGARCRLYVAMSRAKRSVTFVVSRQQPSPLVRL